MNIINTKNSLETFILSSIVVMTISFLFLSAKIAVAEEEFEYAPLVGEVKSLSLTDHTMVIKTDQSKRQLVVLTDQTTLKGVMLAEEIKAKQKVKVWYVIEDNLFKALKIEVMPELGC